MNILIVSFHDDNFGDNLIKICFKSLLKVVLSNLKIKDYKLNDMSLKNIDEQLIKDSDLIFFAGGGLFGLSYLDFFEYLKKIISIAEKNEIPVIFSSIGINNMSIYKSGETRLKNVLRKKCIKAISVRENLELFERYAKNTKLKVTKVCDPGVWARYVYNIDTNTNRNSVGINVVRGGLFEDNNKSWKLKNEMNYLNNLKKALDNNKIKYKFYTNGSILDNNTLNFYAKKNKIKDDLLIYPMTTRELVETMNQFRFVVALRMHSSIISYALDIPSVNLVWNEKIPFFYENINCKEMALDIDNFNVDEIVQFISNVKNSTFDSNYLMTLYDYLFNCLSKIFKVKVNKYDFKKVVQKLSQSSVGIEEDILDYKIKIEKGQRLYLARFMEVKNKEKEIAKEKKEYEKLKNENDILLKNYYHSKDIIEKQKEMLDRLNNGKIVSIIKNNE